MAKKIMTNSQFEEAKQAVSVKIFSCLDTHRKDAQKRNSMVMLSFIVMNHNYVECHYYVCQGDKKS
jgi:hypothetical protein